MLRIAGCVAYACIAGLTALTKILTEGLCRLWGASEQQTIVTCMRISIISNMWFSYVVKC